MNGPHRNCNRHALRIALRNQVLFRDGHVCRECGATENLTLDHIVPRSQGGTHNKRNLQILCEPCNVAKGSAVLS